MIVSAISDFHFLRPYWFLALIPAAIIGWRMIKASDPRQAYQDSIAPHLLSHLVMMPKSRSRFRPLPVLLILWLLGIVALAGPAWRQQPSPFAEETSALVFVVKVTPSMESSDLLPSRLERVRLKVHDLLLMRKGNPHGLIAYAGSAHRVMPITADGEIIDHMLEALNPEMMPSQGDKLSEALQLARSTIEDSGGSGSILVLADDISASEQAALNTLKQGGLRGVQIFASIGESVRMESTGLATGARALGASIQRITADDTDLRAIQSRAQSEIFFGSNLEVQWKDDGFLLVPLIALGLLLWARRGWSVMEGA